MKLTKKLLLCLTLCLVFSSILFSSSIFARADDDDIDPDPDEFDSKTKRNAERIVSIDNDGSTAKLTSILKYSADKDDFSVEITTNGELSFKGLYKSHTESNKINLEFQLRLYTILEYLDEDANGIYDDEMDTYLGEYIIEEFLPIVYTTETIEGKITHKLIIETTDGVFLAQVFIVEVITDINEIIVTPMEIKIDFEIHNYPFIMEEESLLALLVHFQTNAAYGWNERSHAEEEGYEDDETEVEMKNRDATSFFAWLNKAKADDVVVEVVGSPLKDSENGKKIYLNYPHATHIIHDPKIGIVGDFSLFPFFAIGGVVMLIAVAAIVLTIKKKTQIH